VSENILIIKLGALGDFIQAASPFAAIRAYHKDAEITLLTTPPFAGIAERAPWFDRVVIDSRPKLWQMIGWLDLRAKLKLGDFSFVYDLQTSDRSGFYYKLFWPGPIPNWSGIAPGCSHPHANPKRDFMHTIERQREQLEIVGVKDFSDPDFAWVADDTARFGLATPFALLVPAGAGHRPAKRWPVEGYAQVARYLADNGIQPVILGGDDDAWEAEKITQAVPVAKDLIGQTTIDDLIALGRRAEIAIGNDTGPMHPIAMAGCRSLVLYSSDSDPALCAQRGDAVTIIRRDSLAELTLEDVTRSLALGSNNSPS